MVSPDTGADTSPIGRIWSITALALTYLLCIGLLTFWALLLSSNVLVITLVLIIYLLNVMSIALRSFAIDRVVKTHLLAIMGPVLLAFAFRGGYFYIAGGMQLLIALFVDKSAARLRGILLSEMTYRRRSDTVATRFRFAVDNMSHGMCMIDSRMRIVVSNAELSECFGLSPGRSLQGVRFPALIRLATRRGTLSRADADRLMASFDATLAPDSVARLEAAGLNDSVQDLTLKRHVEGGWVLVVQDVTDQRRARAALDRAARFDAMTDLPNRRSFEERLSEALTRRAARKIAPRFCFSTSTASSRSTTRWATNSATGCSPNPPGGCAIRARRLCRALGRGRIRDFAFGARRRLDAAFRAGADRGIVAPDLDRGRGGGGRGDRRRVGLRQRLHQRGRAAATGRHGAVFGQARGARHLPLVRTVDERAGARAPAVGA